MKTKLKTSHLIAIMAVAIVVAAYTLMPFFLVVINVFKNANGIVANPVGFAGMSVSQLITNLTSVINNSNFSFWSAFGTSAVVTILSLVLLAVFGGMAAWVICRNKTKWSSAIYMVFIASMIIPFQVVMLPLISTFRDVGKFVGLSMLQSIPGIVFAYCGFGGAMTVFILTGMIKTIPYDLEEAASIDGCSYEGIYFHIIFPLLRPSIVTVTILNGMWIWNDYLLPSLMLGQSGKVKTLPVAVQAFVGSYVKQWDLILTAALLAMIPMIIIFLIAQKQIMSGMVEGAVK
ncbi:MAG: carbohydrate ABC transporter permease [Clostridiales bacterium]|nr:carbohydrate ABC transporter permease [Clostridiales bacterium]MCD7886367.1 carbohydrate ABC transporter permease [Clostridiales bacterium]MCD8335511.1 carbohydrate ABC transporter permease [Clostridiales bacterium]